MNAVGDDWTREPMLPPNDREYFLTQQDEAHAEAAVMQQMQQARALGMGAAAFVFGMWEGLEDSELSREEKLTLLRAALRGR